MATRNVQSGRLVLSLKAVINSILAFPSQSSVFTLDSGSRTIDMSFGTGLNQFNVGWAADDMLVSSGSPQSISLNDFHDQDVGLGAGLDALGIPIAMTQLCLLLICNRTDGSNPGPITIAPHATNPMQDPFGSSGSSLTIPAGGIQLFTNFAATAWPISSTHNRIAITSGSALARRFDTYILGRV